MSIVYLLLQICVAGRITTATKIDTHTRAELCSRQKQMYTALNPSCQYVCSKRIRKRIIK